MKKYYQLLLGLSAIFVGLLGISSRVRAVTHYVQSRPRRFLCMAGGAVLMPKKKWLMWPVMPV